MKILISIVLLLISTQQRLHCKNGGKPILTRTVQQPYSLTYQCLCPLNYFGKDCNDVRQIRCFVNNSTLPKRFNSHITSNIQLQLEMQCFLKKVNLNGSILEESNFYRLPIDKTTAMNEYSENNYYINSSYQIIWENETSSFDGYGELKREDENDTRTDEEIINQYPVYQFNYSSAFFGVPVYHSKFIYKLKNIKFRNISQEIKEAKVDMRMKSSFPNEKIIVAKINTTIQQSFFQYHVAIIQFSMLQKYGDGYRGTYHTTMNTARWRIHDLNYPKGDQLQPVTNIPSWIWIVLIFIGVGVLILTSKYLIKAYNNWKRKKTLQQLVHDD